jgi:hypothetical protein
MAPQGPLDRARGNSEFADVASSAVRSNSSSKQCRYRYVGSVAYPGIFFGGGGVQQIHLRTEGRQNGDLVAVALVRGSTQFANE